MSQGALISTILYPDLDKRMLSCTIEKAPIEIALVLDPSGYINWNALRSKLRTVEFPSQILALMSPASLGVGKVPAEMQEYWQEQREAVLIRKVNVSRIYRMVSNELFEPRKHALPPVATKAMGLDGAASRGIANYIHRISEAEAEGWNKYLDFFVVVGKSEAEWAFVTDIAEIRDHSRLRGAFVSNKDYLKVLLNDVSKDWGSYIPYSPADVGTAES